MVGKVESELGPIEMPQHDIDNFRSQGISVRDESIDPELLQGLNLRANLT